MDSSQLEPSGLQVELGARPRRHFATSWFVILSITIGVAVLALAGTVILRGEAPNILPIAEQSSSNVDLSSGQLFLHGTGNQANPVTLFLDALSPTASTAKYKDSPGIKFNSGNPWAEIGTWTGSLEGSTTAVPTALNTWVGLKNSDDIGTAFDLRAEVYQNNTLIASGETRCITGITRNAAQAKPVTVRLAVADFLAGTGTLRLKLLTRIGSNPDGTRCTGPGATHSNAVGLQAYFYAANRASKLTLSALAAEHVIQRLANKLPGSQRALECRSRSYLWGLGRAFVPAGSRRDRGVMVHWVGWEKAFRTYKTV